MPVTFTSWIRLHSSSFSFFWCCSYLTVHSFFDEVLRIGEPKYLPNETDVLRARAKTVGIKETRFNMGQLSCVTYILPRQFAQPSSLEYTCSMLEARGQNGENGSTVSNRWLPSFSVQRWANMIKCCSKKKIKYSIEPILDIHSINSSLRTEWQSLWHFSNLW